MSLSSYFFFTGAFGAIFFGGVFFGGSFFGGSFFTEDFLTTLWPFLSGSLFLSRPPEGHLEQSSWFAVIFRSFASAIESYGITRPVNRTLATINPIT